MSEGRRNKVGVEDGTLNIVRRRVVTILIQGSRRKVTTRKMRGDTKLNEQKGGYIHGYIHKKGIVFLHLGGPIVHLERGEYAFIISLDINTKLDGEDLMKLIIKLQEELDKVLEQKTDV